MGILQQPVQAKLSKLLGAEVRFENLNVSLLGGSIEARGVTVAGDDPSEPVLTVRRVRAEISVPRALKKEFVIKSLTIEAPVLSVVRHADGRTNLPKPIKGADDEGGARPDEAKEDRKPAPADDSAGGAWKLEAQRVLLVDGAVRYRAEATPGGGQALDLAAESILAELKAASGGFDFTCIVESVTSRGATPVDLGQLRLAGRADGVADLSQILKARLTATIEASDELLRADVSVPSIKPLEASVRASGAAGVAKILPLLPASVKQRVPMPPSGRVDVSVAATYANDRLAISELSVRATDVRVATAST
jgi:hypothetical protein